ncbi:hypothetical protein JVT61DRAFT_2905 [Boletus reticuloceps]|uniref:Uncharacterized protein n=1 Tax=Boletus reticuloceps TaxID=495285 RepID=A0A8I2YS64_9AGAM|nr:hypothetical protein JVT61DRAFT_2905 [Boletus reticuloceps]
MNTYNFSSFSNNSTAVQTHTGNLGFSSEGIRPQTPDIFGHNATPLMPQGNQVHSYMNQQAYIQGLLERCNSFEAELMKVTTEQDTLKCLFKQLSASLQKPEAATIPTKTAEASAEMYPLVQFWTPDQYNQWTHTAEAHKDPRWKLAYLEDENGATVTDATLKAIRKLMRACWLDLAKKKGPPSWGKADASEKEFVFTIVYREFPFLKLTKNHWKLNTLCSNDYPSWARNNLDKDGNLLKNGKVKEEEGTPGVDEQPTTDNRKCKVKTKKSDVPAKKFKAEESTTHASFSSSPEPSVLVGSPTSPSLSIEPSARVEASPSDSSNLEVPVPVQSSASPLPSIESSSPEPSVPVKSSASESPPPSIEPSTTVEAPPSESCLSSLEASPVPFESSNSIQLSPPSSCTTSELPAVGSSSKSTTSELPVAVRTILSPSATTSEPPGVVRTTTSPLPSTLDSESLAVGSAEPPIVVGTTPSQTSPPQETITVDPLAKLVKKSIILKLPPLPQIPPPAVEAKSNSKRGKSMDTPVSTSRSKGGSKGKMRVAKNKTAYNLCALRWKTQIHDGMSEEFCVYWNQELSQEQCTAYVKEAKELRMDPGRMEIPCAVERSTSALTYLFSSTKFAPFIKSQSCSSSPSAASMA